MKKIRKLHDTSPSHQKNGTQRRMKKWRLPYHEDEPAPKWNSRILFLNSTEPKLWKCSSVGGSISMKLLGAYQIQRQTSSYWSLRGKSRPGHSSTSSWRCYVQAMIPVVIIKISPGRTNWSNIISVNCAISTPSRRVWERPKFASAHGTTELNVLNRTFRTSDLLSTPQWRNGREIQKLPTQKRRKNINLLFSRRFGAGWSNNFVVTTLRVVAFTL